MIHGRQGIREAYSDEAVAREYVERRFREPLGAMLHDQQLACLGRAIRANRSARVLEIAPGPARLTADVAGELVQRGTLVDASWEMLEECRARLTAAGHRKWRLVQGDAFQLPFSRPFDLVYTFRLIRHFDHADRMLLYAGIARLLGPGGLLIFDAVNHAAAATIRQGAGGACQHYDALLTRDRIADELEAAGFRLLRLDDIQRHYRVLYQLQILVAPRSKWLARAAMNLVGRLPGGQPLEWVVTCERR
jgi:ubiquinone/menaquinone biosynthesis C-methylase UbiE